MFKKAIRENIPAKILIDGPSGSGKTKSSLRLAQGLADGGKIAGICSENGSMALYSDSHDFDVCDISSYHPTNYLKALEYAENNGYKVLIIDSITHMWKWAIDTVDNSNSKNSFNAWGPVKKEVNAFIDRLKSSSIHIICTARSKTAFELIEQEKGNRKIKVPQKIGMKPEFQEGFDYEVSYAFSLDSDHVAECHKDRSGELIGTRQVIDEDLGAKIKAWIEDGYSWMDDYAETFEGIEESEIVQYFTEKHSMKITELTEKLRKNILENKDEFLPSFKEWKESVEA